VNGAAVGHSRTAAEHCAHEHQLIGDIVRVNSNSLWVNRAIPLSTASQIRSAVGRCAVWVILHDLPGDGIVYWPKQVALQLGTVRELSRNYLRTVRVHSENCQVTIRELSKY
jgi:hypothetical protein